MRRRFRDYVAKVSWSLMCKTAKQSTIPGLYARAYSAASRAYCWAVPIKGTPRG